MYLIHDNGGRPFKVSIQNNSVIVRKLTVPDVYNNIIMTQNCKRIFIGKSPKNKMTSYSGGFGNKFDGNSILLHIDANKYIFIGKQIFSFDTDSEIIEYYSPVGNSDVPYPYAIDKDGKYYLMGECVIVKEIPHEYLRDPYDYYYKLDLITKDRKCVPNIVPIHPYFDNIDYWFANGNSYTVLRYSKNYYWDDMYVIKTDGKKYKLSKTQFTDLMKRFAEHAGIMDLKTHIIHHRL